MRIDTEAIDAIATLARLELSKPEKAMYAEQLSAVLDLVEQLDEVDTDKVVETSQVTGLEDVIREDEVIDCPEEVKRNIIDQFPEREGDLLKVKAVFT